MKLRPIHFVWIISIVFSCKPSPKKVNADARELNNRAMVIFKNNLLNDDSIQYSLVLLDSAVTLQPDYLDFYFNKIELLTSIHDTSRALQTADDILKQDSMQFNAYLIKGDLYENQRKSDTAKYWYRLALNAIEKYDLMKKSKMMRDLQVIKLYNKLGDSLNYQNGVIKFKQVYGNTPSVKEYLESIKN